MKHYGIYTEFTRWIKKHATYVTIGGKKVAITKAGFPYRGMREFLLHLENEEIFALHNLPGKACMGLKQRWHNFKQKSA